MYLEDIDLVKSIRLGRTGQQDIRCKMSDPNLVSMTRLGKEFTGSLSFKKMGIYFQEGTELG
jgi:hypothetical protein